MSDTTTDPAGGAPAEPAPAGGDSPATQERAGRALSFDTIRPFLGPLVMLALLIVFGALYPDTFLTKTNLVNNVLGQITFLAIVASGQTVVMVVGEFDLSVSGLAALSTVMTAGLIATRTVSGDEASPGPVLWAVLLGLGVGVLGGLLNGYLVSYVGVLAFIATLGMSVVFENLALRRVDGKPVYGLVENNFVDLVQGEWAGIPKTIFYAVAVAAIVWFLLDRTTLGRRMYAVGGNIEAARYSGIDVRRVKLAAFVIAGLGAAIAGIMQSAYNETANTSAPGNWLLMSIAAVFLGMAMFRDGRPNLPGTILGVILLRLIENGLNYTSINNYVQEVILGVAIVVAVVPPALSRLRRAR
ncbi:ABC transporter permease [Ilumatobacter coccineus]|uniref:Autoinducer 2 import system permease protein LsrD n=1 Tax=Ilumatobacter coccineus (strain NBRC 103263 / KCTC 29153 / YM16-304) TaxID=1313172 RepID=A0A6C7EAS8_ILUCY|nr:ABC transporter permease [Ilumatobacter coccineus]BAN03112.1 sugar ABC transporter permease protein [Ilumatobacter coccineus YM16-304]